MLCSGALRKANGRYAVVISAAPTIATRSGGFALDADGRLCITTENPDPSDVYIGAVRCRVDGVIRVNGGAPGVGDATIFANGYRFWNTDNRLAVHNGTGNAAVYANGDPFHDTTAGRLAVDAT